MANESRRQFLKGVGALAGTGAVSGLAGCSDVPVIGSLTGNSVPAYYSDWLFEPGTITEGDHYGFAGLQPSTIDQNEDQFDEDTFTSLERFEDQVSFLGVDFDEMKNVSAVADGMAYVITGEYTVDDVTSELEDNGFSSEGETDNGYEIFANGNSLTGVAVAGNALVVVSAPRGSGGQAQRPSPPSESNARQDLRSIGPGQTRSGTIDSSDPTGDRGTYEPVTFTGSAGDVVTIDMVSEGDPYLILLGPDGSEVARNDDSSGLNSRIDGQRLPADGEYTIVATSYTGGASFSYNLQLTRQFSADDVVTAVEDVVDVENGNTPLYTDEVEQANTLVSSLGGGTILRGRVHAARDQDAPEQGMIEDSVGNGTRIVVDGSSSKWKTVVAYEDSNDVDTGDLEDWVDSASQFDDVDDVSVKQNGKTAVMTGNIDTDDIPTQF